MTATIKSMRRVHVERMTFLGLIALVTAGFIWIISDFLMPVFWALVFGILFQPVMSWWSEKTGGRRTVAVLLALATIVVAIMLPLILAANLVAQQSIAFYNQIVNGPARFDAGAEVLTELVDSSEQWLDFFGIDAQSLRQRLAAAAGAAGQWASSQLLNFGQLTFRFVLQLFIMLYLLFFILRDGEKLRTWFEGVVPLNKTRLRLLIEKFAGTVRAVIKGTIAVAIIQGVLGGILFAIAGIPAPSLWALLMTIAAVIPAIGTGIIWAPAGVALLLSGSIGSGLLVLIGGALLVGGIDNMLRPLLIGNSTKIPDALVLLATLGGLSVFGIAGFVIGPVAAALFLTLWDMFGQEYRTA